MNWQLILAISAPVISALAVVSAPLVGRHAAHKNADAAVQDAFTRAYEAADTHWARYTEAWQKDNDSLRKQIGDNTKRIEEAELRSEAAEVRASKAEHLYSLSIVYLRRVIRWINTNLPGEDYPTPPPELNLDL